MNRPSSARSLVKVLESTMPSDGGRGGGVKEEDERVELFVVSRRASCGAAL